jgi:hypothetical protein
VTAAHEIAAAILDRADHVTKLLVSDAGHKREAQLAGGQQPGEALSVALVGLHAVARRARDLAGRDDTHVDAALRRRTGQPEAGRPGLINRAHPARQRRQELRDLHRRHPQPHATKLTGCHIQHRRMRLRRVDVESHHRHTLRHGRHLPELGCRRQANPAAQSPHISARGADRSTAQAGPDRPP